MIYEGVYHKIDYRIYTYGDGLKYDWVVAPRANPNKIRMELEGVEDVFLLDGRLHIKLVNEITEEKPTLTKSSMVRKEVALCIEATNCLSISPNTDTNPKN